MLIEEISDTELRVRKAAMEDELQFTEENRPPLTDQDRDFVLALLAKPLPPNSNLKKAVKKYRQRHA